MALYSIIVLMCIHLLHVQLIVHWHPPDIAPSGCVQTLFCFCSVQWLVPCWHKKMHIETPLSHTATHLIPVTPFFTVITLHYGWPVVNNCVEVTPRKYSLTHDQSYMVASDAVWAESAVHLYHLLYAIGYKLTIISFSLHPTSKATYSLAVLMCR